MSAMALHPEVMHRAHHEIDSIVGRKRSPTLEDADRLPYISAIVKEVIRWKAVAPVGKRSTSPNRMLGSGLIFSVHRHVSFLCRSTRKHSLDSPLTSLSICSFRMTGIMGISFLKVCASLTRQSR